MKSTLIQNCSQQGWRSRYLDASNLYNESLDSVAYSNIASIAQSYNGVTGAVTVFKATDYTNGSYTVLNCANSGTQHIRDNTANTTEGGKVTHVADLQADRTSAHPILHTYRPASDPYCCRRLCQHWFIRYRSHGVLPRLSHCQR